MMTRHKYDQARAHRLVPLLRSITRELRERNAAIETLEATIDQLKNTAERRGKRANLGELKSELASNRREARLARQELERLGCSLDLDHPLRVLIPGSDGQLEHGYLWDPAEGTLEAAA